MKKRFFLSHAYAITQKMKQQTRVEASQMMGGKSELSHLVADSVIIRQKQYAIFPINPPKKLLTYNLHDCAFIIVKGEKNLFIAHKDYQNDLKLLDQFILDNDRKVEVLLLAGLRSLQSNDKELSQKELELKQFSQKNYDDITQLLYHHKIMLKDEVTFFSDQFNYHSRQHLKITFNPEVTITELPSDISLNALLTLVNRDNFDYFFNYHPEEVLATAGDTILSLRAKDQDYFLTAELQLRLRQLTQNYYFYQQWQQQSSQLINGDSQSERYFNKNKAVILPLYNAFGEHTAQESSIINSNALLRFHHLLIGYQSTLKKLFQESNVDYKLDQFGMPTAENEDINSLIVQYPINIHPDATNRFLIERIKQQTNNGPRPTSRIF